MKRLQRRRRGMGDAHHLNKIVIRTHWQADIEDGFGRDNPEHRLDAPLDLLSIKSPCHEHGPLEGCVRHHFIQAACPPHQRQHPPLMKHGDDSGSRHARVYQALDLLEKGVDLPLFRGDGTIAPVLRCFY
jgi:hypothetical protein